MSETSHYGGLLDDSVDKLELRFSFKEIGDIPVWEWDSELEDLRARAQRKARGDGEEESRRFIAPTTGVGLLPFVGSGGDAGDLKMAGLTMIASTVAKREMQNNMLSFYWMMCFRFQRLVQGAILPEDRTEKIANFYEPALEKFASEAMWRVRAYRNPGIGAREGKFAISINMEVREPYHGSDGKPITRRPVDADGRKIESAAPVQVSPVIFLRVINNQVKIV